MTKLNKTFLCDKIQEECGVFAIYNNNNAIQNTFIGLHNLQHRGQEAWGIVASDSKDLHQKKAKGKVLENLNLIYDAQFKKIYCQHSLGHVRYSTSGDDNWQNIQPLLKTEKTKFALAHNGQIQIPSHNSTKSDSHYIAELINNATTENFAQNFVNIINAIRGAFAIICLTKDKIYAARDKIGIRPLIIGKLDNSIIFCSESCALNALGAEFITEVKNGQILVCEQKQQKLTLTELQEGNKHPAKLCIFEYIYFMRPDSQLTGQSIYKIRKNIGQALALQAPTDSDFILPIQNSGTPFALGYAQQANLPLEFAIFANYYSNRSFIENNSNTREQSTIFKHNIISEIVKNKNITIIDDSIVRGTTIKYITKILRENGAKKINIRIASPIVRFTDNFGIDIKNQNELLSTKCPTISEMRDEIGADDLAFLDIDNLYLALCGQRRNNRSPQFTDHYFTGEYPKL